jgi:hypothetical protein
MSIYKTRWFDRWGRKQGLSTIILCGAVQEITAGLYEADLGGGLIKKRIARTGRGKSGGFRTLLATNKDDRWIFVFGFSKNERANINKLLSLSREDLAVAQDNNELIEVICEEEVNNS